jgi:hypothetical protein
MPGRPDHEATPGTPDDSSLPTVSSFGDCVRPIDQEELGTELQAAFRWAVVGFQTRNSQCGDSDLFRNTMEADPFETDAFKKASFGLIQAAVRLLGSEDALLALLVRERHAALLTLLGLLAAAAPPGRTRTELRLQCVSG